MKFVREGSVCTVRARFFDDLKAATTPSTARYRLRDVTNNRTIVDWTELAPGTYVDIFVDSSSNAIYRNSVSYQEHAVVVQADTGLTTQWTDEVRYQVINLKGFQS